MGRYFHDLNAMAIFVKVVGHGGFSGAANALSMPVSTVSRKVAELERGLGARLLERTTRKVRLTELGEDYYEHCRRGLEEFDTANLMIENRQTEVSGLLRLSVPPNLADSLFVPVMGAFQAAYPKARISVFVTERRLALVEDGIDLAFRVGDLDDSTLVARRLLTYRHILATAPAYLERHGMPGHPDDLRAHRLIGFAGQGLLIRWVLSNADEKISIAVEPQLAMNDYRAIQRAAEDGLGIAEAPALICDQALRHGALVPVLPDWRFPEVSLTAVHAGTRNMSRLVRLFLDFCVERLV